MIWVFRHGIMINRPIEVVFTWVTDPTKAPHWHLDLVEAKILTSGPIRVGTRIKETRWLGISKLHILREIIRYEPPIKYDYTYLDGCGPFQLANDFTFTPVENGTLVQFTANITASFPFYLLLFIPVLILRRHIQKNFARLKQLLEK